MKTLLRKFPQAKLALFGALLITTALLGSKASAAVIYSQDFSTGTGSPLLGTTPTVGGGTWSGVNLFNTAGWTTGNGGAIALAFNPVSGYVYDLTATIGIANDNGSWIGAGFLGSISGAYGFFGPPQTSAAIRNGGSWTTFPGGGNGITSTDLVISLDTTGSQWISTFYQGGFQMGSAYTYTAGNPTINYVGFVSEGTAVGNVSAFQLTATAVPEPSTYALVIGGIATLLLIRRRVQA
jgi:hypothetical protein